MAIEKARAEGIDARMIIVEDDCALPEGKGITSVLPQHGHSYSPQLPSL